MYITTATCPSCGAVLDVIEHKDKELNPVATSMLVQPERSKHRLKSPKCTKHENWMDGWHLSTVYKEHME